MCANICYIIDVVDPNLGIASERHRQILQRAISERVIRVKSLAELLNVHEMTIRRDLDTLCEQGFLRRVHGGASLPQQVGTEIGYHLRANQQVDAKRKIAQEAIKLIHAGDTVALDASTTVLAFAQILGSTDVTAVVSGLDAANALATQGIPFLLTGGSFHAKARSLTGNWVSASLAKIRVDTVFFSAKGLSQVAGFTDAHPAEAEAKVALISSGRRVVALMDHTKFGEEALCQISSVSQVDIVITDLEPSGAHRTFLEEAGTQLIVCNP